jgi:hypothetical protein
MKGNIFKYYREGQLSDMHIPLISQVGSQIRLLRGHGLKSLIAPKAGVRYDGLYVSTPPLIGEETGRL